MTAAPLREIIARYELGALKSLGQHFLLDLNLTARIARSAGDLAGVAVIEIGPGPGGLTRALLDSPGAIDWGSGMDQAAAYVTERDPAVEALAHEHGVPVARIGFVSGAAELVVRTPEGDATWSLEELRAASDATLPALFGQSFHE